MFDTSGMGVFLGMDVGKGKHHAHGLTPAGKTVHDKRMPNSEPKLRALFDKLRAKFGTVLVIVDQIANIGALLLAVARDAGPRWLTSSTFEALRDQESGIPPAPPISDSTLRPLACGAPMYLRAGLWPLYPLADPAMWRFGQWLPFSWRRNKHLARVRLQRLGFDQEVTHPPLRENFHDVLHQALARFGPAAIRTMLNTGSPLIDGKFVDADELAAVALRLEQQQLTEQDGMVAHVLRLHQALI